MIITKSIVNDKALRVKEGYSILGGSNTAYLMSYFVSYLVIFTTANIFLTWCLCANVFVRTDWTLMFVGIELFGFCMIPLSMCVVCTV